MKNTMKDKKLKIEIKYDVIVLGVEPKDFVEANFDDVINFYTQKVKNVYPYCIEQLRFESRDNTVIIFIEDKIK